jgi:hypothetical protein
MTQRFQFTRKNGESVEVEGMRVDLGGDLVTVVDTDGQPLVSFADTDLSSWYRVRTPTNGAVSAQFITSPALRHGSLPGSAATSNAVVASARL